MLWPHSTSAQVDLRALPTTATIDEHAFTVLSAEPYGEEMRVHLQLAQGATSVCSCSRRASSAPAGATPGTARPMAKSGSPAALGIHRSFVSSAWLNACPGRGASASRSGELTHEGRHASRRSTWASDGSAGEGGFEPPIT